MRSKFLLVSLVSHVMLFSTIASAKLVRYELTVKRENVNLSGKKSVDFALTVNGGIPAPTLEFTEGDDAEIVLKNGLSDEEVSTHWHGILLPPEMDGVPYVTTPPIHPGESHTFKFKIRQHGTYWYHSHTMTQEQKGVYGAFVIHPKAEAIRVDKEAVVVLSDWTDENPDQVLRNLRKSGDYYSHKKGTVRSYFGAVAAGGLKNHLANEWIRMGGMDLSDVGYDAFLINGKRDSQLIEAHPGERVRLRIINAGGSSYFYVSLAGLPMRVVSADGVDIAPVDAKELLIGMAETYDVVFTVPEHKNYELRATAQDVTGYVSAWIGMGEKVAAPAKPAPDLYASMDHAAMGHASHGGDHASGAPPAHVDHSAHGAHAGHVVTPAEVVKQVETLTVDQLRAQTPTEFAKDKKVREFTFTLGGSMERYVWFIDGKTIADEKTITIQEGEVVRFTFKNDTMMHHPFHLHGHFFRVLNPEGSYSPLKHTVDVPPHGERTIEFLANEPGDWMLHCHNLYHLKTGMARVVSYATFKPSEEIQHLQKHDPHMHEHLYGAGALEAASNHAKADFRLMRTWDELELRGETANVDGTNFRSQGEWEAEADLFYKRWFTNFLNVEVGPSLYHEKGYGTAGIGYMLPMLIETKVLVNHEGRFRFDVEKRFQWTRDVYSYADFTWRPDWGGDRDSEFEVSLMYSPSWSWAAGLMATEKNVGIGAQIRF